MQAFPGYRTTVEPKRGKPCQTTGLDAIVTDQFGDIGYVDTTGATGAAAHLLEMYAASGPAYSLKAPSTCRRIRQ